MILSIAVDLFILISSPIFVSDLSCSTRVSKYTYSCSLALISLPDSSLPAASYLNFSSESFWKELLKVYMVCLLSTLVINLELSTSSNSIESYMVLDIKFELFIYLDV